MSLTQVWYHFSTLIIMGGVFITIALGFMLFTKPKSRQPPTRNAASDFDNRGRLLTFADTSYDETIQNSGFERRNAVRREGNPVAVLITPDSDRPRPNRVLVVDRSTTGLRLASNENYPMGCILNVRAENAPDTVPWIRIHVCFIRWNGKYFELGCRFTETPAWNILLLFG